MVSEVERELPASSLAVIVTVMFWANSGGTPLNGPIVVCQVPFWAVPPDRVSDVEPDGEGPQLAFTAVTPTLSLAETVSVALVV